MKNYETELDEMKDRLNDIENRYYKQFTAMEKAMSSLNSQSYI
jgi:flagellar hook-associated protein 2